MKILYAVQATGNGHISRAMELLPYLKKYGDVDLFLSGQNSTLQLDAPIVYRSKGLSLFYTCKGTLNYSKLITKLNPVRLYKEINELPVEKYDFIINDFEFITSQACRIKKVPSINFGHQASFISDKTPRPRTKNIAGEFILKNYARATNYMGLHFKQYDNFILPPVIKESIYKADPKNKGHITVYLPAYRDNILENYLLPLKEFEFQVFSAQKSQPEKKANISFIPINQSMFNESLINCQGIVTGAGFETPAEALHLGKKLLAIPINGQYEQQCNAAALAQMGIDTLTGLHDNFTESFYQWVSKPVAATNLSGYSTGEIVNKLMCQSLHPYKQELDFLYPDFVIG